VAHRGLVADIHRVKKLRVLLSFAVAGCAASAAFAGCGNDDSLMGSDVDASGRGRDTGSTTDPGTDPEDGGVRDAPREYVPPPTLLAISPEKVSFGSSFTIRVDAVGLRAGARVLVDGLPAAPVEGDAGLGGADASSDAGAVVSLYAKVRSIDLSARGLVPVVVENAPDNEGSRSDPIYLSVARVGTGLDGGMEFYDLLPDHGKPGDTVRVLGFYFPVGDKTVSDSQGVKAEVVQEGLMTGWPTYGSVEWAEFVIPPGWHSGQVSITPDGQRVAVRGTVFNVGPNVTQGASVSASSASPSPSKPATRAIDDDLTKSWFTNDQNCVSEPTCTAPPQLTVFFATAMNIGRIGVRGNREYRTGYNFLRGRLEILGAGDGGARPILHTRRVVLPNPNHDVDVVLSPPVTGNAVRFVSEADQSTSPGLSELEVFED
jgi:hypothetical protein